MEHLKSRFTKYLVIKAKWTHTPIFLTLMFFYMKVVIFGVSKCAFGKVTPFKIDRTEIVVASKTVLTTFKDIKAEIYVMQRVVWHQTFPNVYGIMEPGLILMEFIGTIKSENMISKTIHSYLGNFVTCKATWYSIVKDTVKVIMFLHSMGLLHNDIVPMFW